MSIVTTHIENLVDERAALFKKLVRLREELKNPSSEIAQGQLDLMKDQEIHMSAYCAALKDRITDLEHQLGIYCG